MNIEFLRELIKKKGGVAKMSKETGISRTTLTRMLKSDIPNQSVRNMEKICAYLGVPLEEVVQAEHSVTAHVICCSKDETAVIQRLRERPEHMDIVKRVLDI